MFLVSRIESIESRYRTLSLFSSKIDRKHTLALEIVLLQQMEKPFKTFSIPNKVGWISIQKKYEVWLWVIDLILAQIFFLQRGLLFVEQSSFEEDNRYSSQARRKSFSYCYRVLPSFDVLVLSCAWDYSLSLRRGKHLLLVWQVNTYGRKVVLSSI